MIVCAVIGLLAILAMPSLSKSRNNAQTQRCVQNMRLIFDGVVQYETETRNSLYPIRSSSASIRQTLLTNQYIRLTKVFECPTSGNNNNADYWLYYANSTTFTNVYCRIATATHVLQ